MQYLLFQYLLLGDSKREHQKVSDAEPEAQSIRQHIHLN